MKTESLEQKARNYLEKLCIETGGRHVGSEGNRLATRFFRDEIAKYGWEPEILAFDAIDWENSGATLKTGSRVFDLLVSPYSLGANVTAEMVAASSAEELAALDAREKIIFLYGEIAKEQLMPKNFVFYNPDEHRQIVSLLEKSGAKAIIAATGRNAELAGGVYPFPLIEDGNFDIPSVYTTEEAGVEILPFTGQTVSLKSGSERIQGRGYNVSGRKGENSSSRILFSAHIDAKKGAPGAIDNATGVIALMLLAELLEKYSGENQIELVAFNGEDYYAVPGQMEFLKANAGKFGQIKLNINIDGAGYFERGTAFSFFGLPEKYRLVAEKVMLKYPEISEGPQWPQGDHSIFVQQGCPAIAVTSKWFLENINSQEITHTPNDNPSIVDVRRIAVIAEALAEFAENI